MSARCAFCNLAICWGEVNENGRVYHDKCTPSARGVKPSEAELKAKEEAEKRKNEFKSQPQVIGSFDVDESAKDGFTIDPITGEKKPLKAGQRFANPRVGKQ